MSIFNNCNLWTNGMLISRNMHSTKEMEVKNEKEISILKLSQNAGL